MKNVKLLMILIILLMVLLGCPNDNAAQTENTGTAVQNKITSLQAVINSGDTKNGDTIDLSQYSDITNYSANINKALTINGAGKDFGQAVITADVDGIGLTGMQNVGTLTASASLGSGSLKISGSSLSNLNILGGGSHSISLFDNVTIDEVVVNKQITADTDDYVRVVLDKTAVLEHTIIKCSTLIDASGDGVILKNVTFDVGDGNVVTMIALSSKLTLFKVSKLVNGVLSYNDAAVSLTLKNDQVSEDGVTLVMPKGTKVSDLSADFVVSAFEMIAGATLEDDLKNAIIGSLTQKISDTLGETFEDDKLVEIILTGDSGIEIKVEDGPVTDTGTHQITYHLYNGMSVTASYSEYEPTAALTNAGRQGYAFTGWFEDESCSGEPLFGWNAGDRTGDVELWAGWEAGKVNYTVKRLFQKVTGDEYESLSEYSDLIKSGITGAMTDVTADSITGFTAVGIEQQKITADGSTVVEVRYNRNVVIYTFGAAGGLWDGDTDTTTVSGRFGASVTSPANPTRAGYTFSGWSPAVPQTFGAVPQSFTAVWTAGTVNYTVKRLFQKVSGDEYEQDLAHYPDLSKTGLSDMTTDVTADIITGFTAVGIEQQKITADDSTVVEVRYNRNVVTYTFDAAGGLWDGDTDTTTVSGRFGADVTLPANPTRAGYTFSGWSPAVPQTFGAVPASYTAQWTINHYTVTFMNGSDEYTTQDVTYDCTVTAPVTDPTKQATDTARYTFAYWYAEDQNVSYDFNTHITAPLTLHAKWNVTPLYKVTIGSVTNGTVTADKTSGIEKGTEITLTVTPNSGYFRDALSVTDSSGVVVTVTDNKFTMPASNVTVTATFKNTVNANGSTVSVSSPVTVTSSTTSLTNNGWYLVSQDVTIESRITVSGTANIILCDGATLTAKYGIKVESGNTLNIYASTSGTGKLVAGLEKNNSLYYQYSQMNYAGIGGKAEDMATSATACGTVNVYGGNIIATGGQDCPGIGGGASGGTVAIYGGSVEAIGGPWDYENPGISCTLTVGSGLNVYAGDSSPGSQTTAAAYSNNRSAYVHIYK